MLLQLIDKNFRTKIIKCIEPTGRGSRMWEKKKECKWEGWKKNCCCSFFLEQKKKIKMLK